MKLSSLLVSLILLLCISCKTDRIKKDINAKNSESETIEESNSDWVEMEKDELEEDVEEIPISKDEVTIMAEYTTQGMILSMPVQITEVFTYFKGDLVKEKLTSSSGGMEMTVIQEFDEKQRLKELTSMQNGELSVKQINEYSDDDLLLSELRFERNEDTFDTIKYEYHYPANRANSMHYYRTNNGRKVTEMKLQKTKNKEILEERAISKYDYVGITTLTKVFDNQGQLLQESKILISSDWSDKTKLDTTIIGPIFYKYDDFGRIIREESKKDLGGLDVIEKYYDDQGILLKKIITKKGKPEKVITYKKVSPLIYK